ncbi:MAG: response regulator [Rhodospirillales bacterium]
MYRSLNKGYRGYDLSNLRVLLVEDNEFLRKLVSSVLASLGIRRVQKAREGGEGWSLFQASSPDLIIVDWVMTPIDGPAFVQRVRQDDKSRNIYIPIIMLSAYGDMSRVIAARDMGVNEFLAKPVSAAQLYDRIERVLEVERPFVRAQDYFGPCRRRRDDPKYSGPERRKDAKDSKDTEDEQ